MGNGRVGLERHDQPFAQRLCPNRLSYEHPSRVAGAARIHFKYTVASPLTVCQIPFLRCFVPPDSSSSTLPVPRHRRAARISLRDHFDDPVPGIVGDPERREITRRCDIGSQLRRDCVFGNLPAGRDAAHVACIEFGEPEISSGLRDPTGLGAGRDSTRKLVTVPPVVMRPT